MTDSAALKILDISDGNPDAIAVKRAYRRMIRYWHPDTYSGDLTHREVTAKAQLINEAFATLSKTRKNTATRTQPKSKPPPATKTAASTSPPKSDYWRVISGETGLRVPYAPNSRHRSLRRKYRDAEVIHGFPTRCLREFFFFSENLVSAAYDPDAKLLYLKFIGGTVYKYFNVPEQVARELIGAESHGKFANRHICYSFKYERVPFG